MILHLDVRFFGDLIIGRLGGLSRWQEAISSGITILGTLVMELHINDKKKGVLILYNHLV
jgi:hypothetical protein